MADDAQSGVLARRRTRRGVVCSYVGLTVDERLVVSQIMNGTSGLLSTSVGTIDGGIGPGRVLRTRT
jgi:hypothetical protein